MSKTASDVTIRLVSIGRDGELSDSTLTPGPEDEQTCQAMIGLYREVGYAPPWIGYLAVDGEEIVGGGAFVAPPAANRVEVAYYTSAGAQRKGYATATAARLVEIARSAQPGVQIVAKTEPRENASTKVLERAGFVRTGLTTDHEIGDAWVWELRS